MSRATSTDDDLNAWADGQLSAERRVAFEQAMSRDPALAARAHELQRQNAWLRSGLDALLHEPLPQSLIDAARPPAVPRRRSRAWLGALVASAAMLVVGMVSGWY